MSTTTSAVMGTGSSSHRAPSPISPANRVPRPLLLDDARDQTSGPKTLRQGREALRLHPIPKGSSDSSGFAHDLY